MKKLKDYLLKFNTNKLTLVGPMDIEMFEHIEPIVYIDGGARHFSGQGFVVGDGDSSDTIMDEKLQTEKNYSDLAYALSQIPDHFTEIHADGFMGGRKDHELINFGEFFSYLDKHKACVNLSRILKLYSPGILKLDINGEFSLINSSEGKLEISGNCKYNFNGLATIPYSSQFLSNKANGELTINSEHSFGIYLIEE